MQRDVTAIVVLKYFNEIYEIQFEVEVLVIKKEIQAYDKLKIHVNQYFHWSGKATTRDSPVLCKILRMKCMNNGAANATASRTVQLLNAAECSTVLAE